MNKQQDIQNFIIDLVWLVASSIFSALAVNWIFIFTGLAPGGITGMSIILSTVTHIPVSVMTLCISVPLLLLSFFVLGTSFGFKTVFVIIMNPLMMAIVPEIDITGIFANINLIIQQIIAALLGGVLVGLAVGLALNHEGATGGTDVIALLIHHYVKKVQVQTILFLLDGIVVILSGIISKDFMVAVFSLISLVVINRVITWFTNHGYTKRK
ncbi:YitT family protein [Faecalicoccus sp.]|uniref:YitT family protein n=1 Tax=Faecalicoccus sp. TaxID=1971758 RepID=UPI0026177B74|nr:YitT family protein [Faecalicoccus sp.]